MDFIEKFLDYKNILSDKEKSYLEGISSQYEIQYLFENRTIHPLILPTPMLKLRAIPTPI
ncbi:MAG: hypothetical protein LBQ34_06150 [Alphaproteobacteria bacterium]|jgi:hypothetical protein|nr:hypothetical protein [Alphaproteobacteria bacterium]